MNVRETRHALQGLPPQLAHFKPRVRKPRRYKNQLPWWRQPPVGYIVTYPLVGLGLLIPFGLQRLGTQNYFLGASFVLTTVIIALIWGTGPAVLSILIGTLTLDVYFLPPFGLLKFEWHETLPLIPFILAEIIVAVITSQRERARQQTLVAQGELATYAHELVHVNQQLEQANQELEKVNQLKDHFLSMASHELKTPITVIRGQVQLGTRRLAKQPDLPSEFAPLQTVLERVDQQTHRLEALVDDLLDLSILSAGKMALRMTKCDVRDVCREVVAEQQTLSGRTIELDVPASPVVLQADCERLSQVVINLVTNAIKYSPKDTAIQVRVTQHTDSVMIQVHNAGPAIPQEQQANIFEPFYRTPAAQSSTKKGWGLGLAISKEIVERHGGHIRVKSSEENGTTFFVDLPVTLK